GVVAMLDRVFEAFERFDGVGADEDRWDNHPTGHLGHFDTKPMGFQAIKTDRVLITVPFQGSPGDVGNRGFLADCIDLAGPEVFVRAPGVIRHGYIFSEWDDSRICWDVSRRFGPSPPALSPSTGEGAGLSGPLSCTRGEGGG